MLASPLLVSVMRQIFLTISALALACLGWSATPAQAEPIAIVAAENFYGDVVRQIGGPNVAVTSILSNPDQDPHLFEAGASTAREIAAARIVIYNGADYDPWMVKLLTGLHDASPEIVEAAKLMGRKPGDNPHLWYDPHTMPVVAETVTALLIKLDPDHRANYEANLSAFETSLDPLHAKIAALRQAYGGTPITATEPIFDYMAQAIGLIVKNKGFQLAVMNGAEPSASQIAAIQDDLKNRSVRVLIYNTQTVEALTTRLQALAKQSGIPVIGVSETEPPGQRYQDWMLAQLTALEAALGGAQK